MPESRILYLGRSICVVDKPPGVLSLEAPGRGASTTLIPRVAAGLRQLGESGKLLPVHRLDEEASGTLVLARDEDSQEVLRRQFEDHAIERIYYALVLGTPRRAQGKLMSQLAEGRSGQVRTVEKGGVKAVTHYATLATLDGFCLVACRLETGRRNQIRVQFADIGHPLVGDRKYGKTDARFRRIRAPRAMLHATGITLTEPGTGRLLRVEAPLPDDFRRVLGEEVAQRFTRAD